MRGKALAALFVVMAVAAVIAAIRMRSRPERPAPALALPDGSVVAIAAVTFGSNHIVGGSLARLTATLPAAVQTWAARIFGKRVTPRFQQTTPAEQLVVWIERQQPRTNEVFTGYYQGFLADQGGFISGQEEWYSESATAHAMAFKVFPRRSRTIYLTLFYHNPTGGVHVCGALPFANPIKNNHPVWRPEPLPATRRTGDVEVVLKRLTTGHGSHTSHRALPGGGSTVEYGTERKDGRNYTGCRVELRSRAGTNQVWQVTGEELSDSTGNSVKNTSMSWSGAGGDFLFRPSLWPDEPAWRLRLELKRQSGFQSNELITFHNVPVGRLGETNVLSWRSNHLNITISLAEIVRRPPPNTNGSWNSSELSELKIVHSALRAETHLDLVRAEGSDGTRIEVPSTSTSGNDRTYYFRSIPAAVTAANFTFAVQQGRTVEFTVKPDLARP